jgi:hypothetical protein
LDFAKKPLTVRKAKNIKNVMQILEGATNHMQHLLICFLTTTAPI